MKQQWLGRGAVTVNQWFISRNRAGRWRGSWRKWVVRRHFSGCVCLIIQPWRIVEQQNQSKPNYLQVWKHGMKKTWFFYFYILRWWSWKQPTKVRVETERFCDFAQAATVGIRFPALLDRPFLIVLPFREGGEGKGDKWYRGLKDAECFEFLETRKVVRKSKIFPIKESRSGCDLLDCFPALSHSFANSFVTECLGLFFSCSFPIILLLYIYFQPLWASCVLLSLPCYCCISFGGEDGSTVKFQLQVSLRRGAPGFQVWVCLLSPISIFTPTCILKFPNAIWF